jgi:hypothetical protein
MVPITTSTTSGTRIIALRSFPGFVVWEAPPVSTAPSQLRMSGVAVPQLFYSSWVASS